MALSRHTLSSQGHKTSLLDSYIFFFQVPVVIWVSFENEMDPLVWRSILDLVAALSEMT